MAVAAGVRAAICMMLEPRPIRLVRAPVQARTVAASVPHASAAQAESKPSRSASSASATSWSGLVPGGAYPIEKPSFTRRC